MGSVFWVSDEPHRAAGHRILHGRGSIAISTREVIVEEAQGNLWNPIGHVGRVDGNNLPVPSETTPLGHVKRFDKRIGIEAGVARIVGPGLACTGAPRGGDVVEIPVRGVQGRWVTRRGDGKEILADVRGSIDVNFPDDEPPIRAHQVVKDTGGVANPAGAGVYARRAATRICQPGCGVRVREGVCGYGRDRESTVVTSHTHARHRHRLIDAETVRYGGRDCYGIACLRSAGRAGGYGDGHGAGEVDSRLVSNRGIVKEVANPVLSQDGSARFGAEERDRTVGDFEVTVRPGGTGNIRRTAATVPRIA